MFGFLTSLLIGFAMAEGVSTPSVLHFYQEFSVPVDVRSVRLVADSDIALALASTLLTFNRDSQLEAALANKWVVDPEGRFIDFELRPDAKWSDGSPITAQDVVTSFMDGRRETGSIYRNVYDAYRSIEARGPKTVRINLEKNVEPSTFLERLVVAPFGIIKSEKGRANLKITSGAYSLQSENESGIVLKVNLHYYQHDPAMFREVHIRRAKNKFISIDRLKTDPWPDLVYPPSMLGKQEMKQVPADSQIWRRPDRLFVMAITNKKNLKASRALISYLRGTEGVSKIAQSAYDARPARQIYASGVALHSEKDPALSSITLDELRVLWPKDSVEIAYDPSRIPAEILTSIRENLCGSLPLKCRLVPVPIREFRRLRLEDKHDFVLSSTIVDPVEPANSVSYFFEPNPPMIPSEKDERWNFAARVKNLRESGQGSLENFRAILSDAVEGGYILPIFHTSSFIIGRRYIDFSLSESAIGSPDYQDIRRRP